MYFNKITYANKSKRRTWNEGLPLLIKKIQ
jgi:hypothetical protein